MTLVQIWKIVTLLLLMYFMGAMPRVMHQEVRPKRAYVYYASIYLIFLSSGVAVLYHFAGGIIWYRTPLIFVGAVLGVIWVESSHRTNVSKVQDNLKSGR